MRDKIAQIIYGYLDWAYCDNCRYGSELPEQCDCCHRKSINWEISKETAEVIADRIMEVVRYE